MATSKKQTEPKAKKKTLTGCLLCKYRVEVPVVPNQWRGETRPSCCFGKEVDDKKVPLKCKEDDLFTEADARILEERTS